MKYLDEYRDPVLARKLVAEIHRVTTRPWTLMEVCGGQTHTIVKQGIDEALPEGVRMIHGPGCPVCVTPLEQVDKALAIAARPDVIFTSYGDMLRVPGSSTDLLALKARGADVRIVYSPLDALKIALANLDRQVVFFAVLFGVAAAALGPFAAVVAPVFAVEPAAFARALVPALAVVRLLADRQRSRRLARGAGEPACAPSARAAPAPRHGGRRRVHRVESRQRATRCGAGGIAAGKLHRDQHQGR